MLKFGGITRPAGFELAALNLAGASPAHYGVGGSQKKMRLAVRADTSSRAAATCAYINHPPFEWSHLGVEGKSRRSAAADVGGNCDRKLGSAAGRAGSA